MRIFLAILLALAFVSTACGGNDSSQGLGESEEAAQETDVSAENVTAVCTELRAEFEQTVNEFGGTELAVGEFEEVADRKTFLRIGVLADYTPPTGAVPEFLLNDYGFVVEMANGSVFAATYEEVYGAYQLLLDEGCQLEWLAELTQPFRDSLNSAAGSNVEIPPEW